MKTFHFKGVRRDGSVVEGLHQAHVLQEVYRRMEYRGLYPVSACELDESAAILLPTPRPEPAPIVTLAA